MIKKLDIKYDKEKDIYIVTGSFGINFTKVISTMLTKEEINALFIKFNSTYFSYYGVFSIYVQNIMTAICERVNKYGINIVDITNYINTVNNINSRKNPVVLNMHNIQNVFNFNISATTKDKYNKLISIKNKFNQRGIVSNELSQTDCLVLAESISANKIIIISDKKTIVTEWLVGLNTTLCKNNSSLYYVNSTTVYHDEKVVVVNYEDVNKLLLNIKYLQGVSTTVIIDCFNTISNTKWYDAVLNLVDLTMSDNIIIKSELQLYSHNKYTSDLFKLLEINLNRYTPLD